MLLFFILFLTSCIKPPSTTAALFPRFAFWCSVFLCEADQRPETAQRPWCLEMAICCPLFPFIIPFHSPGLSYLSLVLFRSTRALRLCGSFMEDAVTQFFLHNTFHYVHYSERNRIATSSLQSCPRGHKETQLLFNTRVFRYRTSKKRKH